MERSFSQIKNLAKNFGVYSALENLGFLAGKNRPWFYRWRGEFLDVIDWQRVASGNGIRVHVFSTIPELVEGYNFSSFPKGAEDVLNNIAGKYLTEEGIGYSMHSWNLRDESNIAKMFEEMINAYIEVADPWFKKITSKELLLNTISPSVLEGPKGENIIRVLSGNA